MRIFICIDPAVFFLCFRVATAAAVILAGIALAT
jgi:hypothetical protein